MVLGFGLLAFGPSEVRAFTRRAGVFVLVALALYAGAYAASERLVYARAQRNRFYVVRSAPPASYDYVILGASHAATFDYRDMTQHLERLAGAKIMNLAVVGGGISVNRLLLEYFLTRHQTRGVVYIVDSFAFYSRDWNENRLQDTRLFVRALFDPALVSLLVRNPTSRFIALDYVLGFSKINNADRFVPDVFPDEESRFTRTYRPVRQIDQQRFEFLYPRQIDSEVLHHYLGEFEALVQYAQSRNLRFIAVKPPLPARIYRMLPDEAQFDSVLKQALDRYGVVLHDFSRVGNDDTFFYDTDHLNRTGVLNFFEKALAPALRAGR